MKRIISLGGNFFQKTAVIAAKRLGYYVIDVDYLPDNPAHKYSDEYYNISTLDKEAVLRLAEEKQVDGIVSFASDVSAPTAAFVAERLGLPTNPLDSVNLMTRKDMFHPFLRDNGFYVPINQVITSEKDIEEFCDKYGENAMLKPVNSSGSKGVTHITSKKDIRLAYEEAKKYSRGDSIVVEQFIERDGYQIAGDAFLVDGEIAFFGVANEHFNNRCNPLVPVGESFPVYLDKDNIEKAKIEIQKALTILNMKNGAINLDFMFDKEGRIFIIELGPRNGGNLITDAIKVASGVDLAEYTVMAAVGEDLSDLKEKSMDKCVSSYIWHSTQDGVIDSIELSKELESHIVQSNFFFEKGEKVYKFNNGGFGLGAAILQYDNQRQMMDMMDNMNEFYNVRYV